MNSCFRTRILFHPVVAARRRTLCCCWNGFLNTHTPLYVPGYAAAFLWPELTYNRGHVSFRPHHPLRQYRHGGVEQWDLSGKTNWKFRESRSPPVLYHLPRQMRRNGYLEIMQINFLNLQHTKVKYDEGMDWSFDRGMVMCWISVHLNIYKLNSLLVWKWNQWIRNQISCAY